MPLFCAWRSAMSFRHPLTFLLNVRAHHTHVFWLLLSIFLVIRVMGAALQILRASEDAKAKREEQKKSRTTRSELFNLSNPQVGRTIHKSVAYLGLFFFS